MAQRAYTLDHVSVCTWNGDASFLNKIGEGTMEITFAEATNTALKDRWEDGRSTIGGAQFEMECAAEIGDQYFKQSGERAQYYFTSQVGTVSGIFECLKTALKVGDALRWNISLKSRGTILRDGV